MVSIATHPTQTVLRIKCFERGGAPLRLAGRALPVQVGETLPAPLHTLCMGPAEWLIVTPEPYTADLSARLAGELAAQNLTLVDITEGIASVEVHGGQARELLSKGCGVDLHPGAFKPGRCCRTRFANVPVVLECLDEMPRFELHVARSYARYLLAWLNDAALEFGVSAP